MARYDAVVLDFDGVLVDSMDVKTRAFAALYQPYGPDVVKRVVEYHLAHGGVTRAAKFRHYHETFLCIPLEAEIASALAGRFSQLVEDAVVAAPSVPGALEFLEKFWRTVPLFVASATPEQELQRIIERRGMSRYFGGVHGAPSTKAEILVNIAKQGGFAPQRMLMVGDARADYDGALAAGTGFVGRADAGSSPFPPDVHVISDLTGLAALL